jgi:hypothetical protein
VHLRVARQQHDQVLLDGHEAQLEDILRAGEEALEGDLAERRLLVQHYLVVLGAHQVVDDARGRQAGRLRVAEPLAGGRTLDDRRRAVDVAVGARPVRQIGRRAGVGLHALLDKVERRGARLRHHGLGIALLNLERLVSVLGRRCDRFVRGPDVLLLLLEEVVRLLRGAVVLGFKGKRLRGLRVGAEVGRVEVLREILILHQWASWG